MVTRTDDLLLMRVLMMLRAPMASLGPLAAPSAWPEAGIP
jgi:hypothetical protein